MLIETTFTVRHSEYDCLDGLVSALACAAFLKTKAPFISVPFHGTLKKKIAQEYTVPTLLWKVHFRKCDFGQVDG